MQGYRVTASSDLGHSWVEVTRTLLSSQTADCFTTDADDEDIIDFLFFLATHDASAKEKAMRGKKKSMKLREGRLQKLKNLIGRCVGPVARLVNRILHPAALIPGKTHYTVRLMT